MSFITNLLSSSKVPEPTPVRWNSPIHDIPVEHQGAAVALFRRLVQEYYPNSTNHDITHYQSSRCSFEQMSQYFNANTIDQTDPVATRIQSEILEALPKVTQGNECEAFEKLENVIKKLGEKGYPEQNIPGLVKQFNSSSQMFVKRFPELVPLILEYKTARAVYDTVLNQWATGYVQSLNLSNGALPLSGRATFVLPNAELGVFDRLLHFIFGYKTETFRMYESRNQYFLNDDHRDFRNFLDRYAHLENPLLSAINSAAQKFHTNLQFNHLSEVKEWLQNPTDPRISLPEKRETIVTAMIEAAEDVVKGIEDSRKVYNIVNPPNPTRKKGKEDETPPEQLQPLKPLFISAFKQLGKKYGVSQEVINNGIDSWFTQFPTNTSFETYQKLTTDLTNAVFRIIALSERDPLIKVPQNKESDVVNKFQELAQEHPQAFKRKGKKIEITNINDVNNWLKQPIETKRLDQTKVLLEFTNWLDDKIDLNLEDEEPVLSSILPRTTIRWSEDPIGYTYQIPSFTPEERLARAAPEYEKGAKGEMQSNPTLNLDEDRIWEKSTRDTLLQIRSSIEQLDQESQKRTIYEFGICAKKHFGEDFNAPSQISKIQTFLSSQHENKMGQEHKAFAEELTLTLSNLAVEQEKRIQRESYAELLLR
ncbi:MAG: hypothetical protein KDK76_01080 [Chlamydiia bacterium]|nr:hypothetical protein [Chlamydiia bacterium]